MPRRSEESDHEENNDPENYYSDADTDLHDDDNDDYTFENSRDPIEYDSPRPCTEWRQIRLGTAVLHVSDQGTVRNDQGSFCASHGLQLPGTPYRIFLVDYERNDQRPCYVHDLVWIAFHGPVPPGWIVRHRPEYTRFAGRIYSNALRHLTIAPMTIETPPSMI